MKQTEREFCGCCGGRLESQTDIWCKSCSRHVSRDLRFWEATYYAQHKRPCPFEVEGQSAWSRQMKIDESRGE
jgi:hypothetical protein